MREAVRRHDHPVYRTLVAERRGRPVEVAVRRHLAQCAICRDLQDFLDDEAGDDLDAAWLSERPVTLPEAAVAELVGASVFDAAPARPARVAIAPTMVPGNTVAARHRSWRWTVGPVGIAAAALLAVFVHDRRSVVRRAPKGTDTVGAGSAAGAKRPDAVSVPTSTAARSPSASTSGRRDAVGGPVLDRGRQSRSVPTAESTAASASANRTPASHVAPNAASAATRTGASSRMRETPGGLNIVLTATSAALDARQVQALDSAVAILTNHLDRRAVVRYTDPSFNGRSASARLAQRTQDHLLVRGIEPGRIKSDRVQGFDRSGLPPNVDVIEVVVRQVPPRDD